MRENLLERSGVCLCTPCVDRSFGGRETAREVGTRLQADPPGGGTPESVDGRVAPKRSMFR